MAREVPEVINWDPVIVTSSSYVLKWTDEGISQNVESGAAWAALQSSFPSSIVIFRFLLYG